MAFWVGEAGHGRPERFRSGDLLQDSFYSDPPSPADGLDYLAWSEARQQQQQQHRYQHHHHHYHDHDVDIDDLSGHAHAFHQDTSRRNTPSPAPPMPVLGTCDASFIVIRERCPSPPGLLGHQGRSLSAPTSSGMERTESGLSISSETSHCPGPGDLAGQDDGTDIAGPLLLTDRAAARLVRDHLASFRRRYPASQHGRILRALILPKSRGAEFALDNDALQSIFLAANELFFANRLANRVRWDWSHPAEAQYRSSIMGTTAVRRSARLGGFETLIVLSSPLLRDTKFNRRLLIATFLHEMIHSYLFVVCGLKARSCGGHTNGFRQIAQIIDRWVGSERLHLVNIEADLELFQTSDFPPGPTETQPAAQSPDQLPMPYKDYPAAHSPEQLLPTSYGEDGDGILWDDRHRDDWHPERSEPVFPSAPSPQYDSSMRTPFDGDGWQWQEREGFLARVPPDEADLPNDDFRAAAAGAPADPPFIYLGLRPPHKHTFSY